MSSTAMPVRRDTTGEWTLWVVAASCALHATEELLTGWQSWARETLGIVMPAGLFVFANAVLVILALRFASIGWRRPMLSLIVPAATLVNGICFHILPAIVQRRAVPGVFTAVLLYLPFSSWSFVAAARAGASRREMAGGAVVGLVVAMSVVLAARALGRVP